MKAASDLLTIRLLDQITDLISDQPKLLLSLYLMRNAAFRLRGDVLPEGAAALLRQILRKAQNSDTETLAYDCHDMMFLICSGTSPDRENALIRQAEALRCLRKYVDQLSPYCDETEKSRLREMEKMLEEDFQRKLRFRRMIRFGELMKKQARFRREIAELAPDLAGAASLVDEIESRREALTQDEQKFLTIFREQAENSAQAEFSIMKAVNQHGTADSIFHATTIGSDENV